MTRLQVRFQNVLEDFPLIVEEFMNNLRNSNSSSSDIDIDDIEWFYIWNMNYDDIEVEDELSRFDMLYEDRLIYELEKVDVIVSMKARHFKRNDIVDSDLIPGEILNIIEEVVKIMMIEEQRFFENMEVIDSIPDIDYLIDEDDMDEQDDANFYQNYIDSYNKMEMDISDSLESEIGLSYELDAVLDKISEHGIELLTKGELEFLRSLSDK